MIQNHRIMLMNFIESVVLKFLKEQLIVTIFLKDMSCINFSMGMLPPEIWKTLPKQDLFSRLIKIMVLLNSITGRLSPALMIPRYGYLSNRLLEQMPVSVILLELRKINFLRATDVSLITNIIIIQL